MTKEQKEEIDYLENQILIVNEVKCEIDDKKARIEKKF